MKMTKQEIFETLSNYLVEYFEVPQSQITLEANLYEDLDLDSIDAVDLVVKLQELTQQKIPPTDFKEVRTVNDVVEKVYELLQK
jgi:acyl carrier protein